MRSARGEDGEIYRVEGDMNYKEWEEKFLKNGDKSNSNKQKATDKNDLTKIENDDKIGYGNNDKSVIDNVLVEKDVRVENLGDNEMGAINRYLGSDGYRLNDSLRNGYKLTSEQEEFVKNLDNALAKMPTYQGNLTRSVHFNFQEQVDDYVADFIIDEMISFSQYISSTCGEIYNPDAPILMQIVNASKGKDIRTYNENEQEILYERNITFKVLNIMYTDIRVIIVLEEV